MEITEVKLTRVKGDDKLKAFVSVTFDDAFVVRDMKIINGRKGDFVAMPSRKLTFHCPNCSKKNPLRSTYCSTCGERLPEEDDKHKKLYADIAHPINQSCRMMIQEKVLSQYRKMLKNDENRRIKDDFEGGQDEGGSSEIEDEVEEQEEQAVEEESDSKTEDEEESSDENNDEDYDDDDDFSEGIW